jgi:2-oxoglutarate dehydrogenase E2 component (dihydrolipoamide succinyltransferase)
MPVMVDVTLPDRQEGTESVVERWLKKPGDPVCLHEPLLEVNTDKAVVELPSPATGVVREILKQPGDPVEPGEVLARIEPHNHEGQPPVAERPTVPAVQAPAGSSLDLSPAVRQLVKQHNLDVSVIRGTGRGGRITVEDVQTYLKNREDAKSGSRKILHSTLRRRIARHMVESLLRTAPHVTAVFEADLSAVVAHRQRHQDEFQQRGVKLTYTAYFVAAAVKALQAVPEVNSRWHDDALEVFGDCNIGIATAVEGGLLVPVIQQAQALDLFGIAARLEELTSKARAGKLAPEEMQHGTFTITNHGVSGSLIATPIINQPQSAILGVGKLEKRVVVREVHGSDGLVILPMAYVTLTIDHRALDGSQANRFLGKLVEALAGW